jgi:hypothetical protein
MTVFTAEITNLAGTVVATLAQREELESPVPLNDSRSASVRIPVQDSAAAEVKPLERMLRIYFRQSANPDPIFWGVINDPDWSAAPGFVTINAQDQWERLMRAQARYADVVVGASTDPHPPNSPTDYTTIRNLILAAENTAAQAAAGDPDIGIKRTGTGTSNSATAAGTSTVQIERGANIAQKIQEIMRAAPGTDVQLYPKTGLGATASGTPYYVALRTFDQQGTDRSATLVFRFRDPEDPANPNNLDDATLSPKGSLVRNHQTSIVQGDGTTPGIRVLASHAASFHTYGPRSGWDNPSGGNTKQMSADALEGHAISVLERYAKPPSFMTLTAKVESAVGTNPNPQWLRDFDVGDLVSVYVKKANLDFDAMFGGAIEMRIMAVHPRQVDAADNARVDIEVSPHVADVGDITSAVDS